MVTIRDRSDDTIEQIMPTGSPVGRPVTGMKMRVGAPGFPESGQAATPTS